VRRVSKPSFAACEKGGSGEARAVSNHPRIKKTGGKRKVRSAGGGGVTF